LLQVADQTGNVPKAIRDMPNLDVVESQYVNAYQFLRPSKMNGMSRGLIPLSEYAAYAQLFDLPEDRETWSYVIRAIDIEIDNSDDENPQS